MDLRPPVPPTAVRRADPPVRGAGVALVGRDALVDQVCAALDAGERLLVLRGPPGVGKTSVARAVAARWRARGGTAVTMLGLNGAGSRGEVLAVLAAAVGLPTRTRDERVQLDRLVSALEARPTVLVLDRVDAARPVVAGVVADLLDASDVPAVLVCAWSRLGLPQECVLAVPPLDASDAAGLLRRLVQRWSPSRTLGDDDAAWLARRAGGLPLALELLASRVASLGTAAVVASLETGAVAGDALDAALDAAWAVLTVPQRDALASLAVLAGPFTVDAAVAVVGSPDAERTLEQLVSASLVETRDPGDDGAAGGRLWLGMLDSVRDHALRRADPAVLHAARARHAAWFARDASPRDRENLLAAWQWSVEHAPAWTGPLAVMLDPLLVTQGPPELHRHVLTASWDALMRGDRSTLAGVRADVAMALGRLEALQSRFHDAVARLEAAQEAAAQAEDTARAGWCASMLCYVLRALGRWDASRAAGQRALDAAVQQRDARLLAQAEQVLGTLELATGRPERALDAYRRAAAAARRAEAPRLVGISVANQALALDALGEAAQALERCAEAQEAFAISDDQFHRARVAVHQACLRARLEVQRGEPTSDGELQRALEGAMAWGDLEGELEAREALVQLAHHAGDEALAARRWDALAAAVRFTQDVAWPARVAHCRPDGVGDVGALSFPPNKGAPLSVDPTKDTAAAGVTGAGVQGPAVLRLSRDGRLLQLGSRTLDLTRRGPLRRVLVALVDLRLRAPGRALTAADVQEAGWPGEKMLAESGAARVYMAVRRLRALGLESLLLTSDAGYHLDARAAVAWLPADHGSAASAP